jgi:glycine cleavage system transcriptional repressor
MKDHLVYSLLGPDRTGLVDRITEVLAQHSANLEDSRMAVLGGEFCMMFVCSVPADQREALQRALGEAAQALGLLQVGKVTSSRQSQSGTLPLQVAVRGADHEGIVHDVVHYLVGKGVSVDNLESQLINAPYSGVPLFEMKMRVSAPASLSLAELRRSLQGVGDRLNVDVEVAAV